MYGNSNCSLESDTIITGYMYFTFFFLSFSTFFCLYSWCAFEYVPTGLCDDLIEKNHGIYMHI